MDIPERKLEIIKAFFVGTADEDYITARWCATNSMPVDFYWLGAQAIEKFLKAILLANGQSVKSHGHDLKKLLHDVKNLVGSLLPEEVFAKDVFMRKEPEARNIEVGLLPVQWTPS